MIARKSWDDVERAALSDPALYQLVNLVRCAGMTREEALIATVLVLAEDRQASIDREIERLKYSRTSAVSAPTTSASHSALGR